MSPRGAPAGLRAALLPAALGALTSVTVASCAPAAAPPERDCTVTVWTQATRAVPSVTGSFMAWARPGLPMNAYGQEGWYSLTLDLPPGETAYLITDDTGTHPDPNNPQRSYRGDDEVSLVTVGDCSRPDLSLDAALAGDDGTITLIGTFRQAAGQGSAPAARLASVSAVEAQGGALAATEITPETGHFVLRGSGFSRGKHTFTLSASAASGAPAEPLRAVAWVAPVARRWEEGLLYQVVIDRFRGDGGAPLAPPETPGKRAGGTLDGVRAAIESGYFEQLGVSTLWLSPVYQNPAGLLEGKDGHLYEGYHGYWPLASRAVEPQIGGEEALRALMATAHAHGLAVLFDFVPNHVYDQNPRYTEHAADGWFNNGPSTCVCGTAGCGWDQHILECWFADYLPDVRWQSDGATHAALDDLRFWMDGFDADGVRIDAVPMMPRLATRRMALALRTGQAPRDALFSIGEVFTGPGQVGTDAIRYFLGPDGLGGAFDFPLTWAMRGAIAQGNAAGFEDIEATLAYSEQSLQGSGSVLGNMVGNHDMARFLSEATGNANGNAWSNPAPDPAEALPYDKLTLALGLVMTLPGLPVIYYGDEVGLAGGSDPDNRRVLPGEAALSLSQRRVLDTTRRMGQLRACSTALKTGSRKPFLTTKRTYGFSRVAATEAAVVMFSIDSEAAQIVPPLKAVPAGTYVDALTAESFELGGGAPVTVSPYSLRILLPENSPCLSASSPSP